MRPTSSRMMRPSTSMQAQLRPISPRPPRKVTWTGSATECLSAEAASRHRSPTAARTASSSGGSGRRQGPGRQAEDLERRPWPRRCCTQVGPTSTSNDGTRRALTSRAGSRSPLSEAAIISACSSAASSGCHADDADGADGQQRQRERRRRRSRRRSRRGARPRRRRPRPGRRAASFRPTIAGHLGGQADDRVDGHGPARCGSARRTCTIGRSAASATARKWASRPAWVGRL